MVPLWVHLPPTWSWREHGNATPSITPPNRRDCALGPRATEASPTIAPKAGCPGSVRGIVARVALLRRRARATRARLFAARRALARVDSWTIGDRAPLGREAPDDHRRCASSACQRKRAAPPSARFHPACARGPWLMLARLSRYAVHPASISGLTPPVRAMVAPMLQ